jgi:hypothetical protein
MPNPSTVAEQLHEELEHARRAYRDLRLSKASREHFLGEVRRIEAELDLPEAERTPNHNGRPGGKHEPSPTEGSVLTLADMQRAKDKLRIGVLPYMDVGLIIFALQAGNEDQRKLAEHLLA